MRANVLTLPRLSESLAAPESRRKRDEGGQSFIRPLAATIPFDDRINQRARLDELSRDLIREFLIEVQSDLAKPARTMPIEKLGRQMNLKELDLTEGRATGIPKILRAM